MTHKQRVLQLLKDGKPHTHHEIYGLGCIGHSRVADLRRDGHKIRAWRDGDQYVYQLEATVQPSFPAASPSTSTPNPVSSSLGANPDTQGRDEVGVLTLFTARTGPGRPW